MITEVARSQIYSFRLYVAGDAQNAAEALANLTRICVASLEGRYDIDVVDVFRQPERALADGIFMTPTLVRVTPSPLRKIVGTLSDLDKVIRALNLPAYAG
jgi:circadian clock protein KaiB